MTSTKEEPKLLKSDAQGRVRTPPDRQESLLDEFERSGLSGARFAALAGIKYPTFAAWVLRRRKQRASNEVSPPTRDSAATVRWLEAVMDQTVGANSAVGGACTVHLPGGARLEFSSPNQIPLVAALVRALAGSGSAC
jgi:hypothetical protein